MHQFTYVYIHIYVCVYKPYTYCTKTDTPQLVISHQLQLTNSEGYHAFEQRTDT